MSDEWTMYPQHPPEHFASPVSFLCEKCGYVIQVDPGETLAVIIAEADDHTCETDEPLRVPT